MSGKSKTRLIVISIIMFVALVISVSGLSRRAGLSQVAAAKEQANLQSQLRQLQIQRREILDKLVHKMEIFLESGRIGIDEFMEANVKLVRAELDLCRNRAERLEVLQKAVKFLITCEEMAAKRADAGRATDIDVDKVKAAVLQARIELAREQMVK